MSNDSHTPYQGPAIINIQDIAGSLVDLPPKATQSLTREKEDLEQLKSEWATVQPSPLGTEFISAPLYQRFLDRSALLEKIRQKRAEVDKMAEVLRETEALVEDAREGDIAIVAKGVKASIQHHGPALEAAFEHTLKYYAQTANKGYATRRKNAEAAQAPQPEATEKKPAEG